MIGIGQGGERVGILSGVRTGRGIRSRSLKIISIVRVEKGVRRVTMTITTTIPTTADQQTEGDETTEEKGKNSDQDQMNEGETLFGQRVERRKRRGVTDRTDRTETFFTRLARTKTG